MRRITSLPLWLDIAALSLVALLLLAFFLGRELSITGGRLGAPLDDAWIHFRFARNLSRGEGFSYNPGQPTPGSTAPLWTLFLAPVGFFNESGDAFLASSIALSAFFFIVTLWLTYGFTQALTGSRRAALLAAVGVMLAGRMLWAGLAGMETTAFAAFSLAAVWAYERQGLRWWPALLFGLASQLRPEGHLLFLMVVGDWILGDRDRDREFLSASLSLSFLVYVATAAPYALFSLATTGRPLPNTFYAKAGTEQLFSLRTLRETLVLHFGDNPVAFGLLPFGLLPALRCSRVAVAWLLILPLATAVMIDATWHHGRYTLPLIPFQMIVAAIGLRWLYYWLTGSFQQTADGRWQAAGAGLMFHGLLILAYFIAGLATFPRWAAMLGMNAREIQEVDIAMAEWLAANTPPDALIAVDDIGAIAFLSERRIVDLLGLVSPEMWPALDEPDRRAAQEVTTRLLSRIQPDYLAVFPIWHWEIAANPLIASERARFAAQSKTIIGEQEAVVYAAEWPYRQQIDPNVARTATLGEAILLRGYDLAHEAGALELILYWESLASVSEKYDVFVHLLDESGQIVSQADSQPVGTMAPTSRWQPSDLIRDPYRLDLPPELPAGMYTLTTGMYLRETGARLPAEGDEIRDNAIVLITLELPPS